MSNNSGSFGPGDSLWKQLFAACGPQRKLSSAGDQIAAQKKSFKTSCRLQRVEKVIRYGHSNFWRKEKLHHANRPIRGPRGACHLGLKVLLIASFALVFAGCVTVARPPNANNSAMLVEARLLDTFGNSVTSERTNTDPTLALGAIPGDIRGSPNQTLQLVHLIETSVLAINTDEFSDKMRREMSRETDDFLISGLSVEPSETLFARVSVTFLRKGSPAYGMVVGFINANSYAPMTLFYFDRPCRMSGTISDDSGAASQITYDVDVKRAGLTWLVAIPQQGGGAIQLVASESMPKMIVAAPVDNLENGRFQLK